MPTASIAANTTATIVHTEAFWGLSVPVCSEAPALGMARVNAGVDGVGVGGADVDDFMVP